MDKVNITNLETLGAAPEQLEEYRRLKAARLENTLRLEAVRALIVSRGGNIVKKRKVKSATRKRTKAQPRRKN